MVAHVTGGDGARAAHSSHASGGQVASVGEASRADYMQVGRGQGQSGSGFTHDVGRSNGGSRGRMWQ